MSLEASTWVRKHAPTKNPTEQVVLMMLADRANDDGTGAWPYYARLAEESRCSVRTVKRALSEMEKRGVIVRGDQSQVAGYPSDRRPIVWDLNMSLDRQNEAGCQFDTSLESGERGVRFDIARCQIRHSEVSDSTERGVTSGTRNPHNHPLTIQEPSNNDQRSVDHVRTVEITESQTGDTPRNAYPPAFEEWWREYPRKVGKGKALKDWKKATKRISNDALILATRHLAEFHKAEDTDTRFIPHPSTWLNRDGWADDLTPSKPKSDGNDIKDWLGEDYTPGMSSIADIFPTGSNGTVIDAEFWEENPKEIY